MHVEHPFAAAHAQRLLYVTEVWRDARVRLDARLGERERFVVVTGEAGTGKTTLMLDAAARWGPRARVAVVSNPALTRLELIEEIARRFGADVSVNASKPQLLGCVETALAAAAGQGQVPVLVVEEAHHLAVELLEELRLVVNQAAQAQRPLEVVLVGLPSLDALLANPALAALRQRIVARCALQPLSHKETRRYVHHRVETAGGDAPKLFPRETCSELHDRSRGIPRAINTLAGEAMRLARETGAGGVTTDHVRAAAAKLFVGAVASDPPAQTEAPAEAPVRAEVSTRVAAQPVVAANSAPAVAANPAPAVAANPPPVVAANPPPVVAANPAPAVAANPPPAVTFTPAAPLDAGAKDPRVSEWVTRFIGSQGPPRIGAALGATDALDWDAIEDEATPALLPAGESGDGEAETRDGASPAQKPRRLIVLDDLPDDVPSSRGAERTPHATARHRSRGGVLGPAITTGVLVIAALATLVVLTHGRRLPLRHADAKTASARPKDSVLPVPAPASKWPESPESQAIAKDSVAAAAEPSTTSTASSPAGPVATSSAAKTAAPSPGVTNVSTEAAMPADAAASDSGVTARKRPRLALQVGSYIDLERARAERERLTAQTGLDGWIVSTPEDGGAYTVVLGIFRGQDRADTAASELLRQGLVAEARVIPLPPRSARL